MHSICYRIIGRIEAKRGCRVVKISVEFVMDKNNKIWLTRTYDCLISLPKESKRYNYNLHTRNTFVYRTYFIFHVSNECQ